MLLSVANWDTDAFPRLQEWLTARLAEGYPPLGGPEAAQTLVRRAQVLPVLDGLDEIPAPARTAILTELNRWSLATDDQIILTCRTGGPPPGRCIRARAHLRRRHRTRTAVSPHGRRLLGLLPAAGPHPSLARGPCSAADWSGLAGG